MQCRPIVIKFVIAYVITNRYQKTALVNMTLLLT